jgi:hypothetical protein
VSSSQEISVPQLAKRLECTIPHAQALIRTGRIRGRKTARGWVTTATAVKEYLAKRSASLNREDGNSRHSAHGPGL